MRIIDGHCHIGDGFEKKLSAEQLLPAMDKSGVERAVICPMEQYLSVYNEEGNAMIVQAVRAHPDRLIGFATANPWYLKRAENILRRGLDMGLRGVKIHSRVQGFVLSSDLIKPLLRIAEEYQVPVYCHTGAFTVAEPFQLRELALEFPKVNFIMGHSGNTDFWTDVQYASEGMENIYLETSHNLSCKGLLSYVGPERVIFGSNMPRSHLGHELENLLAQGLPPDVLQRVCCDNIERLVGGWTR